MAAKRLPIIHGNRFLFPNHDDANHDRRDTLLVLAWHPRRNLGAPRNGGTMTDAKPAPPPKQTRPHARDGGYTCPGRTPCGDPCILNSAKRHQFHTCRNERCPHCHSALRFGRLAEPLNEREPVGWVKA
jgi:hypothetical protein